MKLELCENIDLGWNLHATTFIISIAKEDFFLVIFLIFFLCSLTITLLNRNVRSLDVQASRGAD